MMLRLKSLTSAVSLADAWSGSFAYTNSTAVMLDLPQLLDIIRGADRRSHVFEAIRQVLERFPERAQCEFEEILKHGMSDRSGTILLYYLGHVGCFEDLYGTYEPKFRSSLIQISRDIDSLEEDGPDPFSVDGFPNR